MKILKGFIIIIAVAVVASNCTHQVRADNITSVLRKYNVGIEQINTEALEQELTRAASEYSRVKSEYRERQAMIHTVEITAQVMRDSVQENDINAASVDMRHKEDYLISLIIVDADIEKIFEAEKEYREAQRQLGILLDMSGILVNRIEALSSYDEFLPETELQDVEQAASDLKAAKDKLIGAKKLTEIGAANNLEFPINYSATVTSPFGIRKDPFGGSGTE